MNRITSHAATGLLVAATAFFAGCNRGEDPPASERDTHPPGTSVTNRVEIPATVRQNLGITFAKVERRAVARTLRVPGRFELLPTARREYRASLPGKVEILVEQYKTVEAGIALYRVESPKWREVQSQLNEARASLRLAQAGADSIGPLLEAHEKHHAEIEKAVTLWTDRVKQLEELSATGNVRADDLVQARASLATARSDFAETLEKEAGLQAKRTETAAQLESGKARVALLLSTASAVSGVGVEQLVVESNGVPAWQTLSRIEIRAVAPGVVDAIHATSGSWLEGNAPVVTTVQPQQIRFRARALQSDLGRLEDGLNAAIVPPRGGSLTAGAAMSGTLALAPTADFEHRTIELIVTPQSIAPWARAGVSAFLEVTVGGSGGEELAIPLSCVARDGTQSIIFRRDPKDPDKAIRMEADLGANDGRWVVINSGVREGDEIVADGVYQLMVATSGSITKGGHFHPDGTFHEGED